MAKINNISLKAFPSFFYGLNKDFRIELDETLNREINSNLEKSWLPNKGTKEIWLYDSNSSETKGKFLKKIVRFLDLSSELEDAVYEKNIPKSWNYLNSLSTKQIDRRKKRAKKRLEKHGERYYHTLNKIPTKLSSFCVDEIGKVVASKKLIAQLFLLNPFHGYRDKNSDLGLIMRAGLLYGLVIQLLLIGLITLNKPAKFLTWIVLAGKKYKQTINNLFNEVQILSEKIAKGENGIDSIPSLKHLFGERIVHELSEELDELHQIKREASTIYIEYLLLQFISRDIAINRITFDSNRSIEEDLFLYSQISHKIIQRLNDFERDVFWGHIKLGGTYNPATGLEFLIEWLVENKYYRDMMENVLEVLRKRFQKEMGTNQPPAQKSMIRMLKKLSRTETKKDISNWIWNLSRKIN